MAQRYEKKQYDSLKEQAMAKTVLFMRDPKRFAAPKLTFDEVAILQSRDMDCVLSRVSVCKAEAVALTKLKKEFRRVGLNSIADFIGPSCQGVSTTYGAI